MRFKIVGIMARSFPTFGSGDGRSNQDDSNQAQCNQIKD